MNSYDLADAVGLEVDVFIAGVDGNVLGPDTVLELISPSGDVVAAGTTSPGGVLAQNYDLGIANFQVTHPNAGSTPYRIRVTSPNLGPYIIVVGEAMIFETEENGAPGGPLRKIAPQTSAFGYLFETSFPMNESDEDYYSIDLTTADRVIFETLTPYDQGTGSLANSLDPSLAIYDPSGAIVACASNSAADGKNAFIRFVPPTNGTYLVLIDTDFDGAGSYSLRSTQWENTKPTSVVLAPNLLVENADTSAAPLLVGELITFDPDPLDVDFTYSLVPGPTADDNGLFTIVGNELFINQGVEIDFETQSSYLVHVQSTDEFGASHIQDLQVQVVNLPEVDAVEINDGGEQRSRVDALTITFDGPMTVAPDAFTVTRRGAGGGPVDYNVVTSVNSMNQTVATLTFFGPLVEHGSLVDGNYDLSIDGTKVSGADDRLLDGNEDGLEGGNFVFGDQEADAFFRLFGDTEGNRSVNIVDFGALRRAFGASSGDPQYVDFLDFDQDEVISLVDFGAFRARFGASLPFE